MEKQIEATRSFKVTFNRPEFNATYTFRRMKSGAFAYGNGSCVVVYCNDRVHESYDTRYDQVVMADFGQWCENYLSSHFNAEYEPKWEKSCDNNTKTENKGE